MKRAARIVAALLPAVFLAAGANASGQENIVITVKRVIYPGQPVTADAIVETPLKRPVAGGVEVIREAEDIVGKIAERTILPRRLISPDSLRDDYAVEAGEPTTVYYRDGALVIAMDAVALQSAGYGSPIRVRNQQSGRTITGMVQPDGSVVVEAR